MVQKKGLGGRGQWEDVIKVQSVCVGVCEIAEKRNTFSKSKNKFKSPQGKKKINKRTF